MTGTPKFSPSMLVMLVAEKLSDLGAIDLDEPMTKKAWQRAGLLLLALGVEPEIDADDHSREAEMLRDVLLEERVSIKTKSRRAV